MAEAEKTPEQIEAERVAAEQKAAADAEKKAQKEAEKAAKAEAKKAEREAAKQAKADEVAAKKAEREASKLTQNGITRPMSGATKTVWDIADKISAEKRAPAERKDVLEAGKAAELQEGTINTQYGRWRKFHGLVTVREAKPATPDAPSAPETVQTDTPAGEVEAPVVQ